MALAIKAVGVAIPAAGSGTRMGGVRKPFLTLLDVPVLLHAVRPFLEHPRVQAIAIALGEDDFLHPPAWLTALGPRVSWVKGGASRGESVMAALNALPPSVDAIAVHDAARPLVTRDIIDRCLEAVRTNRGAVAGWPAVDTLKRVDGSSRIVDTVPRNSIWHAQTPQIFPRDLILSAYEAALEAGVTDTDDAALVERVGGKVIMVEGSPTNLKITRQEDLPLAEFFLRAVGPRSPGPP
jgi:2-C-methyl-D-erythritol 4-phosphate cytidylyltransferase